MKSDLDRLTARCNDNIEFSLAELEKFKLNLGLNPFYALENSDGHFHYAAHIRVANHILGQIGKGLSLGEIFAGLSEEILRGARNPSRSTSASYNLAQSALLSVRADYAEWLERRLR